MWQAYILPHTYISLSVATFHFTHGFKTSVGFLHWSSPKPKNQREDLRSLLPIPFQQSQYSSGLELGPGAVISFGRSLHPCVRDQLNSFGFPHTSPA
ncbi:hypothetical protein BDW42DRAFT_179946 [Aspergillus taichungensis]|uniref:Uncharacterized protein n=1 Tax=Aspergillus taichungensis TaxID=482145 RepID=A0A2J5HG34_9EURO|nr:hypothetical protein BDW42DRAFT_179946 [Aspergillus taichungensis]